MSTRYTHIILRTIACYGRTNVGNFESELHTALFELVSSGFVTTKPDGVQHDTLWCQLTHTGYEKLFALNSLIQPAWTQWTQQTCDLGVEIENHTN